jgi:hypothetical protein
VSALAEKVMPDNSEAAAAASSPYEQAICQALDASLEYISQSIKLEVMMAVVVVVLDTLKAVNDQVERRSFGATSLSRTVAAWETKLKQLRVVLLLASRDITSLTVDRIDTGKVSIYGLLAVDTLCFTTHAELAGQHEARCAKATLLALSPPLSTTEKKDAAISSAMPLVAWGKVADRRWADLFAIAEEENADNALSSPSSTDTGSPLNSQARPAKVRRKRPMLLFFPHHNRPTILGAYRSLTFLKRSVPT